MHFLLLVHGGIGLLEYFVYVDDAVAPGQMHKAAAETLVIPRGSCLGEIILYVGDLPLGQLQGAVAQNGAELVAAHPGKDVRGTEMTLYEAGKDFFAVRLSSVYHICPKLSTRQACCSQKESKRKCVA